MTVDNVRDELTHLRDEAAILLETYLARPLLRGVSHLVGCITALGAGLVLVIQASAAMQIVASLIYGAGLVLALGTSALYHRIKWRPRAYQRIRALDHSMIYILIATSCTPFALLLLDGSWRIVVLSVMWGMAALGVAMRWLMSNQPRWLMVATYLGMGWASLLLLPAVDQMSLTMKAMIAACGLLYTVGGLVYLFKYPNPLPRVFGFHEVFHLLVVAAATCNFIAVWPLLTSNTLPGA